MRSFRFILRRCLTTSFRWAHLLPGLPRRREKPCLETSFRASFPSAPSGTGRLVDKQNAPACASLRPRSSATTAHAASIHLGSNPEVSGGNQLSTETGLNLAPTTTPNPTNHPTPGHIKNKKSRDTVGTMSRDNTLCPGGDLNPHVLANTGT